MLRQFVLIILDIKKNGLIRKKNRKLKRINKENLNLKNHLLITVKNNPVQKEGL